MKNILVRIRNTSSTGADGSKAPKPFFGCSFKTDYGQQVDMSTADGNFAVSESKLIALRVALRARPVPAHLLFDQFQQVRRLLDVGMECSKLDTEAVRGVFPLTLFGAGARCARR